MTGKTGNRQGIKIHWVCSSHTDTKLEALAVNAVEDASTDQYKGISWIQNVVPDQKPNFRETFLNPKL